MIFLFSNHQKVHTLLNKPKKKIQIIGKNVMKLLITELSQVWAHDKLIVK
jgi:hypothetical protein